MSKTTPEEAKALAAKYNLHLPGYDCYRLAALIDEVRGVDAEPVAEVVMTVKMPNSSPAWLPHKIIYASLVWLDANPVGTKLYTHPAPSQPAAPVELPVVADLTNNQIDEIVYQCRQVGRDTTYDIVRAAIAAGRKAS